MVEYSNGSGNGSMTPSHNEGNTIGGVVGPSIVKDRYDMLFKYIIIGDTSVGKSCILHHYLRNKFNVNSKHTVGVEFGQRFLTVNSGGQSKILKLQIWDTAGQERYRAVTRSYFRGSLGVIIVYDITSLDSFQHVQQWLNEARQFSRQEATFMLVGNKKDIGDQRVVEMTQGAQFAQENECLFLECSASTGENIEEIFSKITQTIVYKIDSGEIPEDLILNSRSMGSSNSSSAPGNGQQSLINSLNQSNKDKSNGSSSCAC